MYYFSSVVISCKPNTLGYNTNRLCNNYGAIKTYLSLLTIVFEFVDFDAFHCFCHFLFHLFHISETCPFEHTFHQGNKKKSPGGRNKWIGRVGHGSHAVLGQKLLNAQHGVGRCTWKPPILTWANTVKISKIKSLKLNTASHNNASWCTDTEHPPSRGSRTYKGPTLQEKILVFVESPPLNYIICTLYEKIPM